MGEPLSMEAVSMVLYRRIAAPQQRPATRSATNRTGGAMMYQ